MTDACSSASSAARRSTCEPESSTAPTAEQTEAARIAREKAAEAEAEARRNAYFAGTEHEGGRCKNAASDAGAYSPQTPAQNELRNSRLTAGEKPLADDPVGNAIVSAAGGGVVAGVRAATVGSARTGVVTGVLSFVKSFVKGEGKDFVLSTTNTGPELQPPGAPGASKSSEPANGGRTGPKGTSEPAPQPNRSEAPSIPGPVVVRG